MNQIEILPNPLSDALDTKGLLPPNSVKIEGRSVVFFFILFLHIKLNWSNIIVANPESLKPRSTQNLKASIVIFYS